jgi:hypothetical protein
MYGSLWKSLQRFSFQRYFTFSFANMLFSKIKRAIGLLKHDVGLCLYEIPPILNIILFQVQNQRLCRSEAFDEAAAAGKKSVYRAARLQEGA